MNVQDTVAMLTRERPELVPALKAITALSQGTPQVREHANTLLLQILEMQVSIEGKRILAKRMLLLRTGLAPHAGTGSSQSHSLRHVPDVMIRMLCQIAEIPRRSTATDEWLDKMEARVEGRELPNDYEELT